jgi:hypothetical protein
MLFFLNLSEMILNFETYNLESYYSSIKEK